VGGGNVKRDSKTYVLCAASVLASLTLTGALHGQRAPVRLTPAKAKDHIGELATVEGRVFGVYTSRSNTTFLNFGAPFPHQTFTAVIFEAYAGRFPNPSTLDGATVAVTGTIKLYRGKPEITLTARSQLEIETALH
jgi:hypothetical protein